MADFDSFLTRQQQPGLPVASFEDFLASRPPQQPSGVPTATFGDFLASRPPPPTVGAPPGTGNWFTSGLGAGWHDMLSQGARALQAGAQLTGADEAAKSFADFAEAHHATAQSYTRPDLEDASWLSPAKIGYEIAKMIPTTVGAVGAGAVASLGAPEAAAGAGLAALLRTAGARGLMGASAAMYPTAVGGNVQRQIEETGQLTEPGKALVLGAPEAAVQGVLPGLGVGGLGGKLFEKGIMRGIAHGVATQAGAGGATEFLTQQMGDPNRSFADRAAAIGSAALSGAALGGLLGGVFGGYRKLVAKPVVDTTNKDMTDATDPALGLTPPPGGETALSVAPPPVWPPGPATAADVRANMAPPSAVPPAVWPPSSPVVRAAAPPELVPPAVWPPTSPATEVPPAPSIIPPAVWPPGGTPAVQPAEPAAPAVEAPVAPTPEVPRGEPTAPVPGEPPTVAPTPGEPTAAAPAPVLDFTKGAVKAGGALYEAAPPEVQAVMRQPLIDEIVRRAGEGKDPTKLQERWVNELDIWDEVEKAVSERPPEVPPGVTPEVPGAAAPAPPSADVEPPVAPSERIGFSSAGATRTAPPGSQAAAAAVDRATRLAQISTEAAPSAEPAPVAPNLEAMSVSELKAELAKYDQIPVGNKANIITQIKQAQLRDIRFQNKISPEMPGAAESVKDRLARIRAEAARNPSISERDPATWASQAERQATSAVPSTLAEQIAASRAKEPATTGAKERIERALAEPIPAYAKLDVQPDEQGRGYVVTADGGSVSWHPTIGEAYEAKAAIQAKPIRPVASDVPIKTADDRVATLNGIQAEIANLTDLEAKAQHTVEAKRVAELLPLAEGNPGLVPTLNKRLNNLRTAVEAARTLPADHVATPDLAPSPRAEAVPASTGDVDASAKAAQDALFALRTKARGGLGAHPDAGSALDANQKWLADVRKSTGTPEEARALLARDPEAVTEANVDADNLRNLTRVNKPQQDNIAAYLTTQHEAVLQALRGDSNARARVIASRDGLPVTQLDADVTDLHQRGVRAVDVADHLMEHTANPEDAALVAKLRAALPADVKTVFRDGVTDKEGEYFPKQKTIALYNAANATATFIHEMAHAVMHRALEGASTAAEAMRGIYDQLKDMGDHAGITNVHEMVSEAFANSVYRDFLKSKFVRGTSLWDRFIDAAREFIGLDPREFNAFDRIMSLGDDLMKEHTQYPNDWVGPDSFARNLGVKAAANGADQARETLFQQVKDWRDGKGLNMRDAVRRGALAGLDGYRLGELWGHVVKSMRPYVAVLSKEDTRKGTFLKGSQKGQDLANTLTDEGRTLLNKALTATFNGIDPRKPATIEVSENPALSAVHQEFADAYKRLISMPNGEAAYEALRANMSTYHNIGLLDKLQTLERGLSGYTAPDRMNTFDQRIDLHTDPVKTERLFIDAVKNASDSLTAHREQLANQKVTVGNQQMSLDAAVKLKQAVVDTMRKSGGASDAALKELEDLKNQRSEQKSNIGSINDVLKDVANQRDATAKSPYFHIGRHGNYFVTAKLALDPTGEVVDQGKLAKFIEHLDNNGFADIAPMRGGEHDTFYARVKNVSEMNRLEQAVRDAQKQGLLSPDKAGIGSGEATKVFGSIASDSMRKAVEIMKANRPEVPEGVDPIAFNKAFGKQIEDLQRTLLDMTSENSASRLLAQRRNVQGFDQDMIKSQRDAAITMSSHLARMTTAWEKGELTAKMRDEVRDLNHSDADVNTKVGASQAVGEFMLRDALRSAYVPSNPLDVARHITHTWAVGSSPAYFLMLMSQVATTALPELYKTHGIAAVPALLKAMPRTMKIISAMAKSPDRFNADITYDILKAAGIDQPTIDETMGNVARGKLVPAYSVAQTEHSLPTGGVTRTAVQAADALGKYAELIPRLIVSFAARDLYNKSGGYEHPLLGKMTADQFVDRNIIESQGEWAGSLAPRYTSARGGFFGAATPMIDQFMGWQIRMGGKLYQEVQGMFDEKTRPEARRWLIGHGAATTMLAGTLGLPVLSVAASVYDRLMDWVTNRDDHDLTASYRGFLSDTFGKDMGEIIARGLPRAAGMDFEHWGESTIFPGLSAINILFEKRKFEDAERDWAKSMAGAGIGEMANAYLAARDVFNGDYLNGLIKIAPEVLKAPAEAYRLSQRGFVNNLTGQKLPITANGYDIALTALGIDPAKQAEYDEVRREAQGLQTMRQLNSSNIVRHLEQAYMRRDNSMFKTWMNEAQKWQVDHPGMVPPQASFGRELQTHMRASAYAQGMGLPIGVTPRDIGARGALRYGNIPVQ